MKRVVVQGLALAALVLALAVLVATGVGFLIAGLYLQLANEVGRVAAAAWTGGIIIAAVVAVAALAVLVLRWPPRAAAGPLPPVGGQHAGSVVAQGMHWVETHPLAAALTALSAGVVVGNSPAVRELIFTALKELSRRPPG